MPSYKSKVDSARKYRLKATAKGKAKVLAIDVFKRQQLLLGQLEWKQETFINVNKPSSATTIARQSNCTTKATALAQWPYGCSKATILVPPNAVQYTQTAQTMQSHKNTMATSVTKATSVGSPQISELPRSSWRPPRPQKPPGLQGLQRPRELQWPQEAMTITVATKATATSNGC